MTRRTTSSPVDPGLQHERTVLAWDRTGLAITAAALGVARHSLGHLGVVVAATCAFTAACGLWLVVVGLRRGRMSVPSGREPGFRTLRDGRLVALVAGLMALLCVVEGAASLADHLAA